MREGDLLGGRYRLASQLATGGMGVVWRADDETLGRRVAVKVLKSEYAEDPTFVERFRAEARNTAMLTHPGIATVYDYGEVPVEGSAGSSAYLVMELVPGPPLSAVLAEHGPMSPARVMNVVGQAALALQAAHEAGVVHRDIKPGNLLVTADETVKVTDFGIARATDAVPLTQTGTVLGTAFYLSPEQAAGDEVGPPSDIYSLGIVAYECLSGRRPFAGTNPVAVALAHQREQAPPLSPEIPLQVRELVGRAMAKNPPDRPPTAGDFGRAALALRDGIEGTRPMPAMGMPPTSRLAGTRPGGTALLPRGGPQPPPSRRPAPAPAPARRRSRSMRAPLIGLLLLALLVGGFALVKSLGGGKAVPDVKGQQYTPASQILTRAGFTVRVDGARDGVVQSQDPAAGKKAKEKSVVTLRFGSQGVTPATTTVNPSDYVGRRLGDVRSDLAALGFGVSVSGSPSPDATVTNISPSGKVTNGSVISITARLRTSAPTSTSAPKTSSPATSSPSASPSSIPSGSGSGSGAGSGAGSGSGPKLPTSIPGLGNGKGNGNNGSQGNG
ncbi:MAG: eukaryotic-like serine/threonine-protein kinase [Frankiaceae bacterium]|nr:eukaryotic-like serine/threonine-protein kinase [Frankiaceae bacterium]